MLKLTHHARTTTIAFHYCAFLFRDYGGLSSLDHAMVSRKYLFGLWENVDFISLLILQCFTDFIFLKKKTYSEKIIYLSSTKNLTNSFYNLRMVLTELKVTKSDLLRQSQALHCIYIVSTKSMAWDEP